MTTRKTSASRVTAPALRVRRSKVRDAMLEEIEGAIRGAIWRTWKHREDALPSDAERVLVDELAIRIDGVLCDWLDFGGGE